MFNQLHNACLVIEKNLFVQSVICLKRERTGSLNNKYLLPVQKSPPLIFVLALFNHSTPHIHNLYL